MLPFCLFSSNLHQKGQESHKQQGQEESLSEGLSDPNSSTQTLVELWEAWC